MNAAGHRGIEIMSAPNLGFNISEQWKEILKRTVTEAQSWA